jgi:hypothetical protein
LTFSAAPIFSNNSSMLARESPHFRKHRYSHRVSGCRLLHLRSIARFSLMHHRHALNLRHVVVKN